MSELASIPSPAPGEQAPAVLIPPPGRSWRRGLVHLALFGFTAASTVAAGTYLAHFDHDFWRFWAWIKYRPEALLDGIPFSVTLLSILLAHELGHYLVARHHRVDCSLPYFLPGPTLVGTFGAVIFMRSPIPNRKALFDIGAAGPLMGLAVTVAATVAGFYTAETVWYCWNLNTRGTVVFSGNLITSFLHAVIPAPPVDPLLALGNRCEGHDFLSSPLLDAAMVGYLVTALNLLPVGQLDGGHINHAVFGRRSIYVTIAVLLVLAVLAWFWPPWFFLALFLVALMGRRGLRHPPPRDPDSPLGWPRIALALVVLVLFALIFSTAPVDIWSGQIIF